MNLKAGLFSLVALIGTSSAFAATTLQSAPGTFDFGWAPENAHISAEFVVTNKGSDAIGLQALKPACGCTAAKFTPTNLGSSEDTTIALTFNTRGYKNSAFNKSAELTTDAAESNITVYLKGIVTDPEAKIFPVGTGLAAFEPEKKKTSQKITLQNKSDTDVKLSIVQSPASWVKAKLGSDTIKAGKSTEVSIQVSVPLTEVHETSLTIQADADNTYYRVTLAVRTGPAPKEYQPIRPNAASKDPGPKQDNGLHDPLRLKGIEPVKK